MGCWHIFWEKVWADAIAWVLIWGGRYRNPGGLLGAHRDLLGVGEVWDCFWLGSFFHLISLFLLAFLFAFAFAVLALLLFVFAFAFTCAFLFALLSGLVAFLNCFVTFLFCLVALLSGLVAFLLCLVALLCGLVAFLLCLIALFDSVFTFFVYFFTFLGSTSLLLTLLCGGGLCTNSCYASSEPPKMPSSFFS